MSRLTRLALGLLLIAVLCAPGLSSAQAPTQGSQPRFVAFEAFMLST